MGSAVTKLIRKPSTKVNIKRPPRPTPTEEGEASKDALNRPDGELLGRLKEVYVSSSVGSAAKMENTYGSDRKSSLLPQNRRAHDEDPRDEPMSAPRGFLAAKDLTFILQQQIPGNWVSKQKESLSPEEIAQKYGVSVEDAENLIRYFTGFKVVATIKEPAPDMEFHKLHE